jgi:hypothetical protein
MHGKRGVVPLDMAFVALSSPPILDRITALFDEAWIQFHGDGQH